MFKRGLIVSLLSVISLSMFACDSDSDHNNNDSLCKELKCDQIVGDGYAHVCAVISGKAECKNACLGNAVGNNAAVCFSNGSLPPDSRPVFSSVDTCAKDDNGLLYSVGVADTKCDYGCDEATGLCKANGGNDDAACAELRCDQIVGGKAHVCTVISGKAECKVACLGTAEGVNAAVCYSNGSLPPDSRPVFSSVDTCAKDDKGVLYSVSVADTECYYGCNEATGLCKQPQVSCDLDCRVMDKREEACFVINGTPTCKETCLADKEGENGPLCYMESGFAPSYDPDSAIDTCKKDDNGYLYSIGTRIIDDCENGCDEATGLCKMNDSCSLDCINDGGYAQVCVKISGQEKCKNVCLGNLEGENAPVCYENGSLPPESRKQYSLKDTCAKDELGTLYSVDRNEFECPSGCNDADGQCLR